MLEYYQLYPIAAQMRNLPVNTNCPTVAENPDRKALKGCSILALSSTVLRITELGKHRWNFAHARDLVI